MVVLAQRAQRVIKQINNAADNLRHELLAGITDSDLQTCMGVLRRIRERAEKTDSRQRNTPKRRPRVSLERNGQSKLANSISRKGALRSASGGLK
jgi:hypothetical protein